MADRRPERVLQLAGVLNALGPSKGTNLLLRLSREDPVLAEAVRRLMFRFDDLVHLRDASVQILWTEVPRATWLLAMRAAEAPVAEKLLGNISRRAREMFEDDLRGSPRQRRSDVDRAQAEVVAAALRLEDAGRVFIDRPGTPDVYV